MKDSQTYRLPSAAWRQSFRRRLMAWYAANARDLPWRRTRDPYRVWISEVMLQQTQVATVVEYFNRFIAALPTISALAEAEEQTVLRLWEGLGYYRRARALHQAARLIVAEYGGAFPQEFDAVRRLPGIGRYTAGAILSIAFDQRHPILEANTVRLYSRLLAYRGPTHTGSGQQLLWQMAEALLPRRQSGVLNQALMELGATICLPRQPRCDICPVAQLCPTYRDGLQAEIPVVRMKPQVEYVREAAVVVRRGPRVLLLQRLAAERWAGLWDFPRFEISANNGPALEQELAAGVYRLTGLHVRPGAKLATIKHGVTRFRITLDCHEAVCLNGKASNGQSRLLRWLYPRQLAQYPLSTPARRLSRLLQTRK